MRRPCQQKSQTSSTDKLCQTVQTPGFHKLQLINLSTSFAKRDGIRSIPEWFETIFSILMFNLHILVAQNLTKTISLIFNFCVWRNYNCFLEEL